MPSPSDILAQASQLVSSDRRESYGPVEESMQHIATIWSIVLKQPVTGHQVALCMAGLKLCREAFSAKLDNCVDLAAYAGIAGCLAGMVGASTVRTYEQVCPPPASDADVLEEAVQQAACQARRQEEYQAGR